MQRYGTGRRNTIVKNNHFQMNTRDHSDISGELSRNLLRQDFSRDRLYETADAGRQIAKVYSMIENAVAVLSDMRTDISYMYSGGFAATLGLEESPSGETTHSIWEKTVLERVHPDDLRNKYLHELCFFNFMKKQPLASRGRYCYAGKLRMKDREGNYIFVLHRIFYVTDSSDGSFPLSLCLYTPLVSDIPANGLIIDTISGKAAELQMETGRDILSRREAQILEMIDKGLTSRQISESLSISVHTVSRHRQEILSKLQVRNSVEACRIARKLQII